MNQIDSITEKPNKKEVWNAVVLIISFYFIAVIVGFFVSEENYKARFIIAVIPAIVTLGYGYWAATKENYTALKIVFIVLLILVVLNGFLRIF